MPLKEHSFSIGFMFSPLRSAQGRAEYHNSLKILAYMPAIAPSLNYISTDETRMTTSISSEAFEKKEQKVKESKIIQWTKKIE